MKYECQLATERIIQKSTTSQNPDISGPPLFSKIKCFMSKVPRTKSLLDDDDKVKLLTE
jgi:hypothetical protein